MNYLNIFKHLHIWLRNGWPLLLTFFIAIVLVSQLNTGRQLSALNTIFYLDACLWPSVSCTGSDKKQPSTQQREQHTSDLTQNPINGKALHAILEMTTALFIFLNTVMYLCDSIREERKGFHLISAFLITLLCEGITLCWVLSLYFLGFNWVKTLGEALPLFIFIAFTYVDYTSYKKEAANCKKINKSKHAIHHHALKEFALDQMLLVDIPVIVGIGAALWLESYLVKEFSESDHYFEAFFTGAIVMHLAISQIIYFMLSLKKEYAQYPVN